MHTRTISEHFAPAITSAAQLAWTHGRISIHRLKEDKLRSINAMFGAGRINGTARVMLIEIYVDEC